MGDLSLLVPAAGALAAVPVAGGLSTARGKASSSRRVHRRSDGEEGEQSKAVEQHGRSDLSVECVWRMSNPGESSDKQTARYRGVPKKIKSSSERRRRPMLRGVQAALRLHPASLFTHEEID